MRLWDPETDFRATLLFDDERGLAVKVNAATRRALERRYPDRTVRHQLAKVLTDGWGPESPTLFDEGGRGSERRVCAFGCGYGTKPSRKDG